jgi:hypothetical protein
MAEEAKIISFSPLVCFLFHVYQLTTLTYKLESTRSQAQFFRVKLEVGINIDFELTLRCIIVFNIGLEKRSDIKQCLL